MGRVSKILSIIVVLSGICVFFVFAQNEEKLSIVTYYPSPYGVYRNLQWGNQTESVARLDDDGIVLGGTGGAVNPRIWFSNHDPAGPDATIHLTDDTHLTIKAGNMANGEVTIDHDVHIPGDLTVDGAVNADICVSKSYTSDSGTTECPEGYRIASPTPFTPVKYVSVGSYYVGELIVNGIFVCCRVD